MSAILHSYIEKLDKKLHEENRITDVFVKAESLTGIRRVYLAVGTLAFLALYLVVGYGAQLICNSIGFVYPAYASIHAIESHNKDDDTKWLTYWVVFALFSVCEFFSDIFLNWFPFYWLAKCIFLIYCFAPISANGSQVIYHRIIRPFFLKNRETIDTTVKKVAEKALDVTLNAADSLKKD